jgi:heavy metal sensor kinase
MKIFKSIKWRLQLWYGLILVCVLAGFGFTAYQLDRGRLFSRIDDDLHRRIGVLANALHRPPPRGPGGNENPFDRPPPEQFPDGGPPPLGTDQPLPEFHLPSEDVHFFDASDPNNFYFMIKTRDGQELARSTNAPLIPALVNVMTPQPPDSRIQLETVDFGNYRETPNVLPSGEIIWVGCSIAPELKELRLTALKLAAVGAGILLLGLIGGSWLVERALRPIDGISAAAAKISAGDLSQRINVAETESELGRLAAVLNSTFARLETAFAQQQQFTADAAHELRTPVSVMLTQTQTALTRERTAAEYRETIEACQRASQRMRRLIESLLELARLDAGQESLKRVRFDFSKAIADVVALVRPLAEARGVKILPELGSLEITGDSERLAQVIANLLTNAIQYSPSGGEVHLKLASQPGLAALTVADTGPGISSADRPHVFERFYRGDKSRTASNGNAGLGLAISKAIVEAHGGTIEVASQTGTGTTFIVRLPAT